MGLPAFIKKDLTSLLYPVPSEPAFITLPEIITFPFWLIFVS
jgi:hypothetical protein